MPDLFHFKKFSLTDKDCALKIGTDAVLLGSWTDTANSKSILDIGTGSGIIAMMLAQKSFATIDAIEIDEKAAATAEINFNYCPWKDRLKLYPVSLAKFVKANKHIFDLIVSNPPYFQNSKLSDDPLKNVAKHNVNLSYEDLLFSVSKLLNAFGQFCVILPYGQLHPFREKALRYNLRATHITEVIPILNKLPNRVLMQFTNTVENVNCLYDKIIIRQNANCYTADYKSLTKDFLLNS